MEFPRLIAHRGLHNDKIPENSVPAFIAAVKGGYGIELDVRFTADYKIVVFHDKTLERMCGIEGRVSDFTYEQLCCFTLKNTNQKIPLLSEVLKAVDGKASLLIEIKEDCPTLEMYKRLSKLMKNYNGIWAVQSFNPFAVLWFRLFSKETPRGMLISEFEATKDFKHFLRYLCSFPIVWKLIAAPDFINCDLRSISFKQIEQAFNAGCGLMSWTAKGKELIDEALKFSDNVIFDI